MTQSPSTLLLLLNTPSCVDFALEQLLLKVDVCWHLIADSLVLIEQIAETNKTASLLCAQVYFHLSNYDDALSFALDANLPLNSEFTTAITHHAIKALVNGSCDKRVASLVNSLDHSFSKLSLGIAIDCSNITEIHSICLKVPVSEKPDLLNWLLEIALTVVDSLSLRSDILKLLVKLYQTLDEPDYYSVCQCLIHLNDHSSCADILKSLASRDSTHCLVAQQIAFDLQDNATQEFLNNVISSLSGSTDSLQLVKIISGEIGIKLNLEFLSRNNQTDLLILKTTKAALDARSSVYHSAVSFANAFMNAGTTSDEFLRQNLEWLSRASNWAKFTATAALGVIHKGQIEKGRALLEPYLPKDGVSGSAYSEGGALFALGLVNANHGAGVIEFLKTSLKDSNNETIQTGACLGLGVAGMATDDQDVYDTLKTTLFSDSAVAGESAGLAMGLVMLGTRSALAISEMMQYAHETQHEKIIRGISIGISLIMYGAQESAEALIEEMCIDKDPIIRYGGVYTVAMAYSGTGHNNAIKRLLHVAVSDVSDDVRRAAVIAIGFVCFRNYKQVPKVVELLSGSYNPHVRYGATLALGISCASTGYAEALELLEPLLKDTVDFVRQGALIAVAMILVQHNDVQTPKVKVIRKLYESVISDKHEEPMVKFGAVLGQGVIDAGGRNVTVSLSSRDGHSSLPSIVGMALFTQYWYWYPLTHFLCLSFTPTNIIGLDSELNAPKFEFLSNSKPSLFAYVPATKPPTAVVIEKVATAVLSTTAKSKSRQKKSDKDSMDIDVPAVETPVVPVVVEEEVKKKEDPFHVVENMSRVVPMQYKYISFEGTNGKPARFIPVKKGVCGGVVLLMDQTPAEPIEYVIDVPVPVVPPPSAEGPVEPVAPAPFDYVED